MPKARTRTKTLKPPSSIVEYWVIKGAYNAVRAVLTRRGDIGHYYTGLDVLDIEVGAWDHVEGSAEPHTTNREEAEARVQRLIDGGWENFVDPNTTKPKKGVSREVAPTRP